jgi:hypothetical protein
MAVFCWLAWAADEAKELDAAAQLRAATGVKTPDSFQLVAALAAGSTAFLTNDRDLPKIPAFESYNCIRMFSPCAVCVAPALS